MKYFLACTCLMLHFAGEITAQQTTKIADQYGLKAEIKHNSPLYDSVLPLSGPLDIKWRAFHDDNRIHTYRVIGQTRNHLPTGKWSWEEGVWDYSVGVGNDALPAFNSAGLRSKWTGSFIDGNVNGRWEFSIDSVAGNGKHIHNIAKLQIHYKNGIPTGSITLERNFVGHALKLNGSLDHNGFASGVWKLQYFKNGQLHKEERHYEKGLLTQVVLIKGNDRKQILQDHNLAYLSTSKQHLLAPQNAVVIGEHAFSTDEYSTFGLSLVDDLLQNNFKKGWHLAAFPYEIMLTIPSYKRLAFPLNEKEEITINLSQSLIAYQKTAIANSLSGNIFINRSRSEKIDTSVAYLQLQSQRLDLLDSLYKSVSQPLFTYKNRHQQGLHNWIVLLNQNTSAKGEIFESLNVQIPKIATNTSPQQDVLASILQTLKDNEKVLPDYIATIDEAKVSIKREGQLKTLETDMMSKLEQLQQLYADKKGIAAEINKKWIKGDITQLLQTYANTKHYDSAMAIANNIGIYLDSLSSWHSKTDLFDNMSKDIKAQYTHLVYNPYTGLNDIEMVVKRRFLNNVLQVLWPYMDKEMQENNDWKSWKEQWNQRWAVNSFLLGFIPKEDKQSNKIENKIRRDKKPERMLKTILNQVE